MTTNEPGVMMLLATITIFIGIVVVLFVHEIRETIRKKSIRYILLKNVYRDFDPKDFRKLLLFFRINKDKKYPDIYFIFLIQIVSHFPEQYEFYLQKVFDVIKMRTQGISKEIQKALDEFIDTYSSHTNKIAVS